MSNYRKPPFFATAEDDDQYDLTELEEDQVLKQLVDLVLDESAYYDAPQFRGKYETTLKRIQSKYRGEY